MLRKWPFPNKLSEMFAWATGLWIRRVLVRAQEGQLNSAGELTCVSRPAEFRLVCCSSVPTPVQEPAAHQQAPPHFWRVLSALRAGTMSDIGRQTLQTARRS
jgi:hypothetical protein